MADLGFEMSLQILQRQFSGKSFRISPRSGTPTTCTNHVLVASRASCRGTSFCADGQNCTKSSRYPHEGDQKRNTGETVKRSVSGMSRFTAARKNSDWKVSSLCLLSNTIDNVNTGSKMDEQRTGYTEQQLEDDRFSEYNIT